MPASDSKYQRIVIASSIASAACLLVAYSHNCDLAISSGSDPRWTWQLWALVPGIFCVLVWSFQTRRWLRSAGLVSTLGVLAYSAWVLGRTFMTGLGGDMAGLVVLDGILALGVTLGWSALALMIGWAWSSR